jgi:hypothetical protein
VRIHASRVAAGEPPVGFTQLERVPPGGRIAILLSDCPHTKGGDPLGPAAALGGLHVLGTGVDPDSVAAGKALARLQAVLR